MKIVIASFLFIFLIGATIITIVNFDNWFTNSIVVTHPNGCNDTYINGDLIGESCNIDHPFISNTLNFTINSTIIGG